MVIKNWGLFVHIPTHAKQHAGLSYVNLGRNDSLKILNLRNTMYEKTHHNLQQTE
jgi:hypothetical protein